VENWIGQPIEQWDERGKRKVLKDQKGVERVVRPGIDPSSRAIPEDTPPNKAVLKPHSGLRKAESSALVQARAGRIGLVKFLYSRKVPSVLSTLCRCTVEEETFRHIALFRTDEIERR
jgi:hypothetical protein